MDPRSVEVHGITETALRDGRAPAQGMATFVELARRPGTIVVAHNARFDVDRFNHTARRHGLDGVRLEASVFCTMHASKHHCIFRDRRGRRKSPRNDELHAHLVGGELPALHDALNDARVTGAVYFAARRRGWW